LTFKPLLFNFVIFFVLHFHVSFRFCPSKYHSPVHTPILPQPRISSSYIYDETKASKYCNYNLFHAPSGFPLTTKSCGICYKLAEILGECFTRIGHRLLLSPRHHLSSYWYNHISPFPVFFSLVIFAYFAISRRNTNVCMGQHSVSPT